MGVFAGADVVHQDVGDRTRAITILYQRGMGANAICTFVAVQPWAFKGQLGA